MEMNNLMEEELHVAQQSRRDKLRVQHNIMTSSTNFNHDHHQLTPIMVDPSEILLNNNGNCHYKPSLSYNYHDHQNWSSSSMAGIYNNNNNNVHNWENNGGNIIINQVDLLPENTSLRGLSLSLSSNQLSEIRRLGSGESMSNSVQLYPSPLGPFTGYATILKSSKFMKPAQMLLDELISAVGLRINNNNNNNNNNLSVISSKLLCGSNNDLSSGSNSCESYKSDCNEAKANLLHMQEEVCKRHKQYHQQMQMAISAFDSVPGLSNATPYISRSIKSISRQFRRLKNAIADQLKHIKKALGETDFSSPTSFSKVDNPNLRLDHQNFTKFKSGGVGSMGYVGHQNHIWRPQRGLPERAVSILRAWLFDHFLHPYPTDTDKQMLATQTGLSRNQVSNWFINARVRLWKPMVEEIHMLETKGVPRPEPISNNSEISAIVNNSKQAADINQPGCKPANINAMHDSKHLEYLGSSSSIKRSRMENHQIIPSTSMDGSGSGSGSFVGFLPYPRRGLELGGIGPVSLTLGLRHGSESTQQQQLQQHQFQPQGMHFGGHVIHDFSC